MDKNKSALIIGAGVGGISTAIFLARNGYKVKVYEKNSNPGGRCGQIVRDGHRFDLGATLILMPGIYKSVFLSMGLKFEDTINIKPLPVIYKLYFSDGDAIEFTTDLEKMDSQVEAMEKGSKDNFRTYIANGYKMFNLAYKELLNRNFFHLFDFVNFRNVSLLIKIKTYLSHMFYAGKFFKSNNLRVAFTFQNIYVGQNQKDERNSG